MSELARKAEWLVRIPSPTGQEQEICAQLLRWADERFPNARVHRYRCGFLLEPEASPDDRPRVALVGHVDTVPSAEHQQVGVSGDKLYGCGASDMKAGVAVMMQALEHYRDFPCSLTGLFYDREEGPYADNGLEPLLEHLPAVEFAVVFEPTNNAVQAGCVGSLQARVHFRGRRAHSARPWQGENALYKAVPLLTRLAQRPRQRVECQGLEFFEVVTATQAFCPGPSNAVPELFSLNLNSRFAPGKSVATAIEELRALVDADGELEIVDAAPSGAVEMHHPALRRWIEAESLALEPKQAWTDVARFSQRGIPAFNFGPGDPAQAHQANEFVRLDALEQGYRRLLSLLHQF